MKTIAIISWVSVIALSLCYQTVRAVIEYRRDKKLWKEDKQWKCP